MRFTISKVDNSPQEVIGGIIVHDTATDLPIFQTEMINSIPVGEGVNRYNTGFIPETIKRNKYISADEKEVLLKNQKEAAIRVVDELFGKTVAKGIKPDIEDTNRFIWANPKYSQFSVTNDTTNLIYDTDDLSTLILYWQIVSDAFGLVGYNIPHAMSKNAPYFVQEIKDSEIRDSREENDKLDAMFVVGKLKEEGNQEALLYLTWALGDRNNKLVGFNKSTQIPTLTKALYNFIEGKTKERGKKNAVNEFMKIYSEYKAEEGFKVYSPW